MLSFLNSVVGVGGLGSAANSSITLVNSNSPNTNEINEIFNEIEDRDPRSQQVEILNNHLWKHARIMEGAEKMLSVPDMQDFVRQQVETELFNATSRVDAITAKRNEILITILKSGPGSTAGSIFKLAYIANTNETYKIFDYTSSMGPWKQVNILDHYLRTQLRMLEGAEKMLSAPDMTESLRQQIETELSHVKSRIDAVAARRDEIHESKKSILMALRPVPTASSSSTFITSAAFTDEINEILNNIESRDPSQQVKILDNHLEKYTRILEGAGRMLSVPDITESLRQQVESELSNAKSMIDAIKSKRNEIHTSILDGNQLTEKSGQAQH